MYPPQAFRFFAAHFVGSIVFDCVHYASHSVSRRSLLARWHSHHHKFQDTSRRIHRRSRHVDYVVCCTGNYWFCLDLRDVRLVSAEANNLKYHIIPEYMITIFPAALLIGCNVLEAPIGVASYILVRTCMCVPMFAMMLCHLSQTVSHPEQIRDCGIRPEGH